MSDFFRFPHTPHIAWLGAGMPRDDKVLAEHEVASLLSGPVSVEEKLDGANLGISIGSGNRLHFQNRGQYLTRPFTGQFSRLTAWVAQHQNTLLDELSEHLIVFGEWCAAKHSLDYQNLPDWFVMFDVYDRTEHSFWSSKRRNDLAAKLDLATVPTLHQGKINLRELKNLLDISHSRYRAGPPEGLVVRKDSDDWCTARAKLVRAEFTQAISEHWRNRKLDWNKVQMATNSN